MKADNIHRQNIQDTIERRVVNNSSIACAAQLPPGAMLGDTEDMNVLIQNSIWQSAPVSQLERFRPVKDLQNKGSWASNQRDQIQRLGNKFGEIADNIIRFCV